MEKTFENDSFVVRVDEEAGCRLAAEVEVKPARVAKAHKRAIKLINKEISIPGFRKGKAPAETVLSKFGSHVEKEWKDILAQEAFRAALDLTSVFPLNQDSIGPVNVTQCSLEEGATVTLSYEHYPIVPDVDLSSLKIPEVAIAEVTEEAVEDVLSELRRAHADWEDVTERAVEKGDYVDLTIEGIDTDPPSEIVTDRRFEVLEKKMAPWLYNLLLGMQVDATVEAVSEVDPDADENVKKNFKPTRCRIALLGIKKILLPEVDDELAKRAGAESKEDLLSKISSNLERDAEEKQQQERLEKLEDALLAAYPFDLPTSLVEGERRERIKRRIEHMKRHGMGEEEIKAHEGHVEEEVTREVDTSLRLFFLNKKLAEQGKISLSQDEIKAEVSRHIVENLYRYGQEQAQTPSKETISRLTNDLLMRKAKEWALSEVLKTPAQKA